MLNRKNSFVALAACLVLCVSGMKTFAADDVAAADNVAAANDVKAVDDVWIVNSHTPSWTRPSDAEFAKITYSHLADARWQPRDAAAFADSLREGVPVVIYVPGYTTTSCDLTSIGMSMIRYYGPDRTARTVFWNWPAERVTSGLAQDIRMKIPVATANAEYLARFIRTLPADTKVSIVAFSFGARVACDAVEKLKDDRPEGLRVRLVLMGAATDWHWLGEKYRHADVPKIAEKILVMYNPEDRALHFYPRLYGGGRGPEALGRFGPPRSLILPEFRDRLEAINIYPYVGPKHQTILHLCTPAFRNRVGTYLFFEE